MVTEFFGIIELSIDGAGGVEKFPDLVIGELRSEVAAALAIELIVGSWVVEQLVPDQQRDSQRPAGVSGSRLDPDLVEWALAETTAVGDTVERHAAGQAQVPHPGGFVNVSGHPQHRFLGDGLDTGGDVHVPLGQGRLGCSRRSVKERVELRRGHRQALAVVEVFQVHCQ